MNGQLIVMWAVVIGLVVAGLLARSRIARWAERPALRAWDIPVLNYLFLLWFILVMVFILGQKLASGFLLEGEHTDTLAYNGIVLALCVHGPVILLLGVLSWVPAGRLWAGVMSEPPRLPLRAVLKKSLMYLLEGMPVFLGTAFLWNAFLALLKYWGYEIESEPQELVSIMLHTEAWELLVGLALAAVVLAPLSEEFIFRAVLYRYLRKPLRNAQVAAGVSGLLFGAIHFNLAALGALAALGYLLARAYERSADFRVPVVMHGIFNLVMILWLMLLRVMGIEML